MNMNTPKAVQSKVTPMQLQRCLALLWKAKVPAAIIGDVGSGKTTAVLDFAKRMKEKTNDSFNTYLTVLSYKSPEDIGGVPYPNKETGRVEYFMPKDLPFGTDENCLIYGDEFDRAAPEVQNSFLQVLLGGEIHGSCISENAFVVLSMNGETDIYTTPLSKAAATRVCSLFVGGSKEKNSESWQVWAAENDIGLEAKVFEKMRGGSLISQQEDFEEIAICTRRTLVYADRIYKAAESVKFKTSDILLACLSGVIGFTAAVEFMSMKEIVSECPEVGDILYDPNSCQIPNNPALNFVVLEVLNESVLEWTADEVKRHGDAIFTFIGRLDTEWQKMYFDRLTATCSALLSNGTAIKLAQRLHG